jgi:hypothetical protein
MASNHLKDMTLEELSSLIERIVDRRLKYASQTQDARTLDEINTSIRQHRITLPSGAKSSLEFLREDRDA